MSTGITKKDLDQWITDLNKAKLSQPSMVIIWANEGAFDKMPDKMFLSMCEDKRVKLHATKATIKKVNDRYKKLMKEKNG